MGKGNSWNSRQISEDRPVTNIAADLGMGNVKLAYRPKLKLSKG